ncbi:Beta-ketoadipate enol-lactone hydrolase [Chondromyces apiculatus DSM 436]|uniref:Beta-ketoadipate enol-lactone hydrolase n=1 Tax=Chondromyces apiculatus DSM 436 TaxID=1192034 RepID=A0A017SZ59_9BACT|nr:alpha/beta fold hydrolase [Chondromyces apiculatus]EYF01556.1 Beta-ketoadipate enol-lactone hydrolase [Chondromyces apiculatus DSM 436]
MLAADREGVPVVFIHGNCSSGRFFEDVLAALPAGYRGIAPDMRGYGDSEALEIDATRGLRDWSDDLRALLQHQDLGLGDARPHLVGWSVGGGVIMQYAMDNPGAVASLTLLAPVSPHGFGGTKDAAGTPCFEDYAGSGGGTANADFAKRLSAKDASDEADTSPRRVMNQYYFRPPFRVSPEKEDLFVSEILKMKVGEGHYPGDLSTSKNWPTLAPGVRGVNNAFAPKYLNLTGFAALAPQPPVLWIRGAEDQIVSDSSLFDLGFLGKLGAVPGWPGDEVFPPQPMIGQTRAVLDAYRARGGRVREEVLPEVGHSPHIEAQAAFLDLFTRFLAEVR